LRISDYRSKVMTSVFGLE